MLSYHSHEYIADPHAEDLLFAFTAQEILLINNFFPSFGKLQLQEMPAQFYCFAQYLGRRCLLLENNDLLMPQEQFNWINVRNASHFLNDNQYSIALLGKHLLHWRLHSRFCGRCGAAAVDKSDERARVCPACQAIHFPRIAPVVIVLITRGEQLLLARSPHFLPGIYSAVAGFVEAGESLEEAAHREVREEVGVNIKHLEYICSQAWPYPDSLMLGFTAEYDSGELLIDKTEIEDAAWFSISNLPQLPSVQSIAHQLIAFYINKIDTIK